MSTENANLDEQDPSRDQMRQTILMLNLAVAQISFSMTQGDESVDTLSHAFTGMIEIINSVEKHTLELSDETSKKQVILDECGKVEHRMREIIIAFQFYDKLSQRLNHVGASLGSLSEIIGDDRRLYHADAWIALQSYIRSKYTMREEIRMFDAIVQGYSVDEALKLVIDSENEVQEDDIELF